MKNIHPKVKAGALASAVVTAVIAILAACSITVPDSVAATLVLLASTLAGYMQKSPPVVVDDSGDGDGAAG